MDKNVLRAIPYGMYLVSAKDNDKNVGCIINTFMQVTSDLVVTINLNKDNYTTSVIDKTRKFIVSLLSINASKDVISKFGYFSSKDTDKFSDFNYSYYNDIPILNDGVVANIYCEVLNFVDAGSHYIVVAKILDMKKLNDDEIMTYSYYRNELKGTTPKNASTFIKEEKEEGKEKYQCLICGYIYDEAKESLKFEDLPDDFVCPICGVSKSNFKKVG